MGHPKRAKIHVTILHFTFFLGQISRHFLGQTWPKKKRISKPDFVDLRAPETPSYPQDHPKKTKKRQKAPKPVFQYETDHPKSAKKSAKKYPNQFSNTKLCFFKNVRISIIKPSFLKVGEAVCKLKIDTNNLREEKKRKNKNINISIKKNKKNKKKHQHILQKQQKTQKQT